MKPPKRGITKPARYQTTESSDDGENVTIEKYDLTKDEVHNEVESDVLALSQVFVETQHVLNKKDDENNSLLLNRNQLPNNKSSIRSHVILDFPLENLKASSSSYHNEPTISKQHDMSHFNVLYNDPVASTSSTVISNAQYEPTNSSLVSYQSETYKEDELCTKKSVKNIDNQHYDYLSNKRPETTLKTYERNNTSKLHLYNKLQTDNENVPEKIYYNLDAKKLVDKRTKTEVKVHSPVYTPAEKKDIEFTSSIAEDFRRLYKWIDTRFANIEEIIQNSLKSKKKKKCWSKPSFLPFTSEEEVLQFDNVKESIYNEVICYLQYIGGFSLKEALNLCLKETVEDEVMSSFTFYGNKEEGIYSFFKTKLCSAIQEALSENKHFQIQSGTEFRHDMIEAIRNAKQRKRNTINKKENRGKRYIREEEMQKIFMQRQQKHLRKE
ncbi:uncharacterized protein LOC105207097 isoform X2 [Solenopsis invicta]|uniref:uncharacterized protein LOC105207097 isoform X2 n=1 Tax=Solenopsis invicta TaxID=13686 RepID=UPI00193D903A|nr:uncharacterized protein LOC105207097 isoform X2 [Solenopsis invicta]XP_039302870.1 uncharacterized protein LOC105207097 isoform X2 [Solenopsis invicta]